MFAAFSSDLYNYVNTQIDTFFIIAGLFEIGGGYLVWQWVKEDKPWWYGLAGGIILVLALLWAWKVDGFRRDKYDILGAGIALNEACIIIYTPRQA